MGCSTAADCSQAGSPCGGGRALQHSNCHNVHYRLNVRTGTGWWVRRFAAPTPHRPRPRPAVSCSTSIHRDASSFAESLQITGCVATGLLQQRRRRQALSSTASTAVGNQHCDPGIGSSPDTRSAGSCSGAPRLTTRASRRPASPYCVVPCRFIIDRAHSRSWVSRTPVHRRNAKTVITIWSISPPSAAGRPAARGRAARRAGPSAPGWSRCSRCGAPRRRGSSRTGWPW